jgi:Methyltransferase FkbM domain
MSRPEPGVLAGPRNPRETRVGRRIQSNEIMVKATSLDAYIIERGIRVDFLKIDVESSEWDVLQGAQHVLTKIRPVVSLEVGDFGINGVVPSRDLVRYLLETVTGPTNMALRMSLW